MANNRLYIFDTQTGNKMMIAKSSGMGWFKQDEPTLEKFVENLLNLLDPDDFCNYNCDESYGNCFDAKTKFILITENDPEFIKLCEKFNEVKIKGGE